MPILTPEHEGEINMNTYAVTAFFNLNMREAGFDGFAGQPLITSGLGERLIDAESVQAAAELTFRDLNMDDRPNGRMERSLSVGDVIRVVAPHEARTYWLSCSNLRWTLLDEVPTDIAPWQPFESWPHVH